jgi:hypothetical protein
MMFQAVVFFRSASMRQSFQTGQTVEIMFGYHTGLTGTVVGYCGYDVDGYHVMVEGDEGPPTLFFHDEIRHVERQPYTRYGIPVNGAVFLFSTTTEAHRFCQRRGVSFHLVRQLPNG